MHDRRVVRGNTFAALVIPVSKFLLILTFQICKLRFAPKVSSNRKDLKGSGKHLEKMLTQ